ncbi:hypothetical protein JXA88_04425 [Candidatus Fermentibacteria bacterium]|nr:hypothetical protein [Candidatus Fermentibacteria bacterium]
MCGQLLLALLLGIASHTRLHVATVPTGLDVWVNESMRGPAPVTVEDIAPGLCSIRVASRHHWAIQPVDTVVHLRQGTNYLVLTAPGALQIICEGLAAMVEEDERIIGHTPLLISRAASRRHRFRVWTDGIVLHQWDWTPSPGAFATVSVFPPRLIAKSPRHGRIRGAAVAAAASAAMAVASAVLARHADDAFDDYAATANPDRGRTLFRRARRLDRWSSGLWTGFEIGAAAALVWWIVSP